MNRNFIYINDKYVLYYQAIVYKFYFNNGRRNKSGNKARAARNISKNGNIIHSKGNTSNKHNISRNRGNIRVMIAMGIIGINQPGITLRFSEFITRAVSQYPDYGMVKNDCNRYNQKSVLFEMFHMKIGNKIAMLNMFYNINVR